jgi:hypothetical protein
MRVRAWWKKTPIAAMIVVALALSACGGSASFSFGGKDSPETVAEDLIEGELSDQLGFGALVASCESPGTSDVGTTFTCTGTVGATTIDFAAEVDREDHVSVVSTNVLLASDLVALETAAVQVLNDQFDLGLPEGAVDCGDSAVVLNTANEMVCALTDPGNGDIYDATLTITDMDQGTFDIDVAAAPR